MAPHDILTDKIAIFQELVMAKPENKVCFDCNAENPTWASIWFGVFICVECSVTHRTLDLEIKSVRSTKLDSWTLKQLNMVSLGGNNRAQVFFKQHGWTDGGNMEAKYTSRAAELYRQFLSKEVEMGMPSSFLASVLRDATNWLLGVNAVENPCISGKKPVDAKMTRKIGGPGVRKLTLEETDEARRKFPNAKSISSAQFFGDQEKMNDTEAKLRLQKFETSTAISSADFFECGANNPPPAPSLSIKEWLRSVKTVWPN